MTRIIRYIVICVALGIISTFLAVQICAAWVPVWDSDLITQGVTAQDGRAWRIAIYKRTGATFSRAQAIWDVALYHHGTFANVNRVLDPGSYEPAELLGEPPDPALPFESRLLTTSRGWPFPSLRGELLISDDELLASPHRSSKLAPIGLDTSQLVFTSDPIVDDDYGIPLLRPIWGGFALDTGLYAGIWAIVLCIGVPVWRMLGPRRLLWRGAIALILGGLTTVAVAWACALLTDVANGRTWTEVYRVQRASDRFVYVLQSIGFGATHLRQQDESQGTSTRGMPSIGIQSPNLPGSGSFAVTIVDARGWPFQALSSRYDASVSRQSGRGTIEQIKYGLLVESSSLAAASPLRSVRVLPFGPMGVGFAADSAFYGGIWFALLILGAVPMWVRAEGRKRRGECESCGYDLRGSSGGACPECGMELCDEGKR